MGEHLKDGEHHLSHAVTVSMAAPLPLNPKPKPPSLRPWTSATDVRGLQGF